MSKKSRTLRFVWGVFLLYLGVEFIRYVWIGIPLSIGGILLVISYIKQMRKKEED